MTSLAAAHGSGVVEAVRTTRHWHKRIVRSGPHTLLPYRENPPDWEIGDDPVKHRLRDDLSEVFAAGKAIFKEHPEIAGEQLKPVR